MNGSGDVIGFLCTASNTYSLHLVWRNFLELKKRGVYDKVRVVMPPPTLRRLGEARELIKAIASLTSKPGNNKTVAALNEFLKLSNTKLQELHDDLSTAPSSASPERRMHC